MTGNTTLAEKKVTPALAYGNPDEVSADKTLSRAQQIAVLREWHYDAKRLQEAQSENMSGGEPDRLQAVSDALLALGVNITEETDPHAAG
jgi:5-enolpyruvylshikimate-3-phosphate synthase